MVEVEQTTCTFHKYIFPKSQSKMDELYVYYSYPNENFQLHIDKIDHIL